MVEILVRIGDILGSNSIGPELNERYIVLLLWKRMRPHHCMLTTCKCSAISTSSSYFRSLWLSRNVLQQLGTLIIYNFSMSLVNTRYQVSASSYIAKYGSHICPEQWRAVNYIVKYVFIRETVTRQEINDLPVHHRLDFIHKAHRAACHTPKSPRSCHGQDYPFAGEFEYERDNLR